MNVVKLFISFTHHQLHGLCQYDVVMGKKPKKRRYYLNEDMTCHVEVVGQ